MSGASMMQGSGRPQVSDEPRRGNFGAPVKLSENMKTPETARISPKSPVMSRALLCGPSTRASFFHRRLEKMPPVPEAGRGLGFCFLSVVLFLFFKV